jgi:hypothetical protein
VIDRVVYSKVIPMSTSAVSYDELEMMERAANEVLARALGVMVHPDERVRRQAVPHFMRMAIPLARDRLLDGLMNLLNCPDPGLRQRAAASLEDAGAVAVNAIVYRLGKSRDPEAQLRLAEVITRAGRQLSPLETMIFRPALELVRQNTRHEQVRAAVARAIEDLGLVDRLPEQGGAGEVACTGTAARQEPPAATVPAPMVAREPPM